MILIRAGRVLGPAEGLDIKADVVLDGERIAGIFPADQGGAEGAPGFSTRERQYEQIIEAEGLAAAPGLVDVHGCPCIQGYHAVPGHQGILCQGW